MFGRIPAVFRDFFSVHNLSAGVASARSCSRIATPLTWVFLSYIVMDFVINFKAKNVIGIQIFKQKEHQEWWTLACMDKFWNFEILINFYMKKPSNCFVYACFIVIHENMHRISSMGANDWFYFEAYHL